MWLSISIMALVPVGDPAPSTSSPERASITDSRDTREVRVSFTDLSGREDRVAPIRKALEPLAWIESVRLKGDVATLVVVRKQYEARKIQELLAKAGFTARILDENTPVANKYRRVTFKVLGLMKTKSGAT